MRVTNLLRVIFRKNGRPEWIEVCDPQLPKGFNIFDYSPKYFGGIILFSGLCVYVSMQADMHPDSIHAKIMNFTSVMTNSVSKAVDKVTDDGTNYESVEANVD